MLGDLCFPHDRTSPTAKFIVEFLHQKHIRGIEYPPYSPDLAICDFWLLSDLKKSLRNRCFHSNEKINEARKTYFSLTPRNGWLEAFNLKKIRL